mmetsp:Transcript_22423/g.67476  ORF Transcript_22423/g.67476 Transcript_22423/m.67476 type:complete len:268 (+) Transcript_22423:1427-2230(+)
MAFTTKEELPVFAPCAREISTRVTSTGGASRNDLSTCGTARIIQHCKPIKTPAAGSDRCCEGGTDNVTHFASPPAEVEHCPRFGRVTLASPDLGKGGAAVYFQFGQTLSVVRERVLRASVVEEGNARNRMPCWADLHARSVHQEKAVGAPNTNVLVLGTAAMTVGDIRKRRWRRRWSGSRKKRRLCRRSGSRRRCWLERGRRRRRGSRIPCGLTSWPGRWQLRWWQTGKGCGHQGGLECRCGSGGVGWCSGGAESRRTNSETRQLGN